MPALKSFGVPEPSVFTTVGSSPSFYGSIICFHEFEQALGAGDGQESLVGCRLWGHPESDTTEVTEQQQQDKLACSGGYVY